MLLLGFAGIGYVGFRRSKGPISAFDCPDHEFDKTKGRLWAAFLFRLTTAAPHPGLSENRSAHGLSVARGRRGGRGSECAGPVQAQKHPAPKLMCKLLRKYAVVPERLVTDDLRSYGATTIETRHRPPARPRTMEEQSGPENSHQPHPTAGAQDATLQRTWAQRKNSSQPTPPPTTLSTSNPISRQLGHTGTVRLSAR
jgi:hypothetical protein